MSARLRSFGDSPAPADEPEISTLARALNPKELSEQLKLVSHSQWRDALREVRIQILKQRSSKRCTFKVEKVKTGRPIDVAQLQKLLKDRKTDLLENFISRTGKPFNAYLVLEGKGKVTFEFPPREGDSQQN